MIARHRTKHSPGFTIIELLIATAVFAVVLVIITIGIIQIARVYYKGVTEANTQNTARTIIDTVSQAIQFSGGTVTAAPGGTSAGQSFAFCIANQQFSYTLGYQVEDNPSPSSYQTYHALVQNATSGCTSSAAAQNVRLPAVLGRELIGKHMRLANIVVQPIAGTAGYQVKVRVVYGDDDLIYSPSSNPAGPRAVDAACIPGQGGTQFCAVAELSTIVQKRVQ